jgi:phospholipase/carboxylesterase
VLIIDGEKDSRRSPGDGLRLAERLVRARALVTHHVLPLGHSITAEDKRIASGRLQAILRCVPIRLELAARSALHVLLTDERG